ESEVESLTTEQNIIYQPDDKTISYIQILDSKTKKLIKARFYKQDGKTLNYITEYDSITGDETKTTYYNPD
ncbi:DUF2963 domain-containing protein, partial [Paulownia witches'-broom phytoplasma]|uniref:DUF2963 domain-containing protein n=1 Tax=Paulownia witches'-broom phytoplasma TaxID=39647 RepID=UPI0030D8F3DF